MALGGWGVWSLVGMTLVNNAAGAILIWRTTDWRPRWREVSLARARELWPFSSRILGFNILKALVQNVDRLVIGFVLGAGALGIYTFAWRVVVFPVRVLSSALGAYLFPKASRLQHDHPAVRTQYLTIMALLLSVVVPAMVAEALLAPVVITGIFGTKWASAVLPMQVLTVTALAGAFYPLAGDLVKAMNRPGWMVAWSALYTVVSGGALWLGAGSGLIPAVIAMSVAHVLLLPVVLSMVNRAVGLRIGEALTRWLPSVAGSAVLASIIWIALRFTPLPSLSRAAVALLLGALGHAAVLAYLDPELGRLLLGRTSPTAQLSGLARGPQVKEES
ncbi:MAG: oligosaccharide flippase family protein, partial [Gemmatimonadales bacterium]|nr:oligosaccharide flippase family protein [Gemmatimonadales bacterium]